MRRPDRQSRCNSAAISPSVGSAKSGVPYPTILPLLARGKDPSTPLRRPLRVSGLSEPRGNRGIVVVGRAPYGLEWEGPYPLRPQHDNRERRLNGGLGCPLQWSAYRRPMESVRNVSPHKLSGTSSRLLRIGKKNIHIQLLMDNMTAFTFINEMGEPNPVP